MMQVIYTYKLNTEPQRHSAFSALFSPFIQYITILCLCVFVFILAGCTKADIHYPTTASADGIVMIYPDQSDHILPALQYHFYNMDTSQEYIVRSCDGSGNFEGVLPVGTYQVIATNTNAQNVEFTGMASHETAMAAAQALTRMATHNSQLTTHNFLAQPGEVYSTVIGELTVSQQDTLRYEPTPVLLTKRLKLIFTLQGTLADDTESLSGVLHGVYPSMHLYTCSHTEEGANQSPDMAIEFNTKEHGTNQRQAQVNLFGLCDPEYGNVYTNRLPLTLTLKDGEIMNTTLNLTDVLSDIIYQNEGTIPLELTVPIEVKRVGIGIEGTITGWIDEGGANVNVPV